MIAKFLGPICQSLNRMCIAIGTHIEPIIKGKCNQTLALPICAEKMASSSLWIDRHGMKITDFISCTLAHRGHKYKPSEMSHCTHRPVSQQTHRVHNEYCSAHFLDQDLTNRFAIKDKYLKDTCKYDYNTHGYPVHNTVEFEKSASSKLKRSIKTRRKRDREPFRIPAKTF